MIDTLKNIYMQNTPCRNNPYKLIVLLLFTCMTACTKPNDMANGHNPDEPPSALNAVKLENVNYGGDNQQKMDVYLPAGRSTTNTKILVLIHGGGWTSGDKSEFNGIIDSLKKRLPDYAIFNVNYRLGNWGVNLFPTQEQDVNAAVNFINSKREEYKISGTWVYAGASAGGHLAMLQGYKNNTAIKPRVVINYYGPADLEALFNESNADLITKLLYKGLYNGTDVQSSPIHFINAQTPPTITLEGSTDGLVPPSLQTALHAKLKASGVAESYQLYQGEGHGFSAATMTKSYDAIVAFLNIHVK